MSRVILAFAAAVAASWAAGADDRRPDARREVECPLRGPAPALTSITEELGLLVMLQDTTGRTVLSDGIVTVTLCHGMSTVLVDGNAVRLPGPVLEDERGIMVSNSGLRAIRTAIQEARVRGLRKVVIDPGHGGKDTGAIGNGGLCEKDVNLGVALRLAGKLRDRGIEAVLTRDSDVFVELDDRVVICNRQRPDLFVSIHANSSPADDVEGVETFYVRETIDDFARARNALRNGGGIVQGLKLKKEERELGLALYHTMFDMSRRMSIDIGEKVNVSLQRGLASSNRGVKEAGFRVLKGAECPAVLVEIGFLSNPSTEHRLRLPEYLEKVAEAVASGL